MPYSNRVHRPGGPDQWIGNYATRREATDASRKALKVRDTVWVETWQGYDPGTGFIPKTFIRRRERDDNSVSGTET